MPAADGPQPGTRCARCHRYLLGTARIRRTLGGRWRHESCTEAPEPSPDDFAGLATVLMRHQPWPRLQSLDAQLREVSEELAAQQVPRQAGPPRVEQLEERLSTLRAAIESERSWKAGRLAVEWSAGH